MIFRSAAVARPVALGPCRYFRLGQVSSGAVSSVRLLPGGAVPALSLTTQIAQFWLARIKIPGQPLGAPIGGLCAPHRGL
jgi:hypothetical protein